MDRFTILVRKMLVSRLFFFEIPLISPCFLDMQKFPLRMKDNDLLVTELYKDATNDHITAISVYLTPKITSLCGNWIEIAYGTRSGSVRVIVQHPETVGHGPQLFQTFTVHQSPVTKVSAIALRDYMTQHRSCYKEF